MPMYDITTPDGRKLTVQGDDPEGAAKAAQEYVQSNAPAPNTAPAAPSENVFQRAGRLTGQAFQGASDAYKRDIAQAGSNINDGSAISHPLQQLAPVLDAAGAAFSPVKGVMDATFGDKPLHLPSVVAGMNVPQWMQDINSKGMTGGDVAMALTPGVGVVADGAKAAISAVRDAADASPAGNVLSAAKQAVTNVAGVGKRAAAATSEMQGATQAQYATDLDAAKAQSAAAADRAQRAAALAQQAKVRSATLAARSSDAAAQAVPPDPAVGTPQSLTDLGESVRQSAYANQTKIEDQMRQADAVHRAALDAAADEQAKTGVGAADGPLGQALIAKSNAVVNPSATRPTVGYVPVSGDGTKLHQMVLDTLSPPPEALPDGTTFKDALALKKQGIQVIQNSPGSYSRVVKPDLESVDNLRRLVGKIAGGDVEGYGAVNKLEAGNLYKDLNGVQDEYVNGLSKPVQQNWADGKQALAPFENIRTGQALVGTQPGSSTFSVPAANIPGRIISGGADTVRQAAAVADPEPVAAMLRNHVQNTLQGLKGSGAIEKAFATNKPLGDALTTQPDLASAVQDYLAQTKAAEAQGASAQDLASRSATNSDRAAKLGKIADALQGTSAKAQAAAAANSRDLATLSIADPKTVGSMYKTMLDRAHAAGSIDDGGYAQGLQLAANAEKEYALKATRDTWIKNAAKIVGIGSVPFAATSAVHTVLGH